MDISTLGTVFLYTEPTGAGGGDTARLLLASKSNLDDEALDTLAKITAGSTSSSVRAVRVTLMP